MLTAGAGCSESVVQTATQDFAAETDVPVYTCQATQLPYFTADLDWWASVSTSKTIAPAMSASDACSPDWSIRSITAAARRVLVSAAPSDGSTTDLRRFWTHTHFPRRVGPIPVGHPTPTGTLNVQPGELVHVKSHQEILNTLNEGSQNRGLWWDAEMVPYCGGTYRVLKRVTRIIQENTGRMQELKNPCIILDSVVPGSIQ